MIPSLKELWSDVTPLEQYEGPNSVIPIAYTAEFKETMDLFRAVLQLNEYSDRSFDLVTKVIELNPANYTAWYFRRVLLDKLNKDLYEELNYTKETAEDSPKNYQIWHHRRCLVLKLNDASKEREFTEFILEEDEDSKNYHAWAHRQWAIKEFNLWDQELDFVEKKLQEDFRNNSAWNHRYFVIKSTTDMSVSVRTSEIQYAFQWLNKAPNNQSPWNYITGLVQDNKFSDFPIVKEKCLEFQTKFKSCTHCDSILMDIYVEEGDVEKAISICDGLITKDEIRKKYWEYRKNLLAK